MPTITFTCETITPMFLSGADGSTPELRPPSIKGALRFWWRAMNGHLANTANGGIPNLLQEDERLFGGVNSGGKSSVLVRVFDREEKFIDGQKLQTYAEYDRNNRKVPYQKEGLAYLYYVLLNQKLKGLEGFDVETTFKVSLESKSLEDLRKGVAAFWLFIYLGGLGSRARRGAGAITVCPNGIEDKDNILDNFIQFKPQNGISMWDFIQNTLTKIRGQFPNTQKLQVSNEYSTIAPNHIYVSKKDDFSTWQEAVDDIGMIMKKLRKGKGHFKRNNRTFTMDTLDQKAAFGLPLRVQDDNELNFSSNDYNRRSSPICISVVKNISNDKFNWVVVHLQGRFMPPDSSLFFESINQNMTYPKREYSFPKEKDSLLKKFVNQVEAQSTQITY